MEAVRARHERAVKNGARAFLYNQRLHLIVLKGTRTMFYEYATACSDRLASLHDEMKNRSPATVRPGCSLSADDAKQRILLRANSSF
ncbi:hypothetical protein NP493_469g01025 [Ridgeia piscesae]|uniref:Uncharacterized protein n=1 Tax=Ridgeia piscesae TaxID=27915 RepID=A0AAD9KYT3_RIDPI|nr:hypothetical protein NP493_469g01025 [Ridgeia piscesae]